VRAPGRDPDPREPDPAPRSSVAPWRPVTRRAFVTALGAAASALAIRRTARWAGAGNPEGDDGAEADRPPSRWAGETRWIGHC